MFLTGVVTPALLKDRPGYPGVTTMFLTSYPYALRVQ